MDTDSPSVNDGISVEGQTAARNDAPKWPVTFEMRDESLSEVTMGNILQMNLIELGKADRLNLAPGPLAAWVTFFEHWQEELTMANVEHEPVKQAMSRIRQLSADEEARRLAFVRERALRDEVSLLNDARQQGEMRLLTKLIGMKFGDIPAWVHEKLDSATPEQLEAWGERILTANSFDELFKS